MLLNETANAAPTSAYYDGGAAAASGGSTAWNSFVNGNANISNFSTDSAGATNATGQVGAGTSVYFSASTIAGAPSSITTAPGQANTINSLTFLTGSPAVTINGANALTINPSSGPGITDQAMSAAHIISAPVVLGGTSVVQSWEIDNVTNPFTVSGAISGSGNGITKTGAGTLILSSPSISYSGPTNVNAGYLVLNGTHTGGSTYTIGNTSTPATLANLMGSGSTASSVLVNANGTVEPGNGLGSGALTIGGISGTASAGSTSGSTLQIDVNFNGNAAHTGNTTGIGDTAGEIIIPSTATGTPVALTGLILNLKLINSATPGVMLGQSETFVLIDNQTSQAYSSTNVFANVIPATGSGAPSFTYSINYQDDVEGSSTTGGNDVALTITAVPEPTSLGLLGLSGLALMRRRRRGAKGGNNGGAVPAL